ncbi:Ustilago B locus mating-type [Kalmanozyma brasiliensis GHG001]|uniref:Ustilago B locus mating-type n=1 Tax=Kalmanozyma brasiliensis (strain GHG001) TaxID=1365824 RepID=UPI002867DF04|nr:Ustilago B locus mating-type [Kalmanozyma brasiliensis GHG001]KAF6767376.1 Ustilago B locus mating-type [Kalmanozyma brasiliensis GHG001]
MKQLVHPKILTSSPSTHSATVTSAFDDFPRDNLGPPLTAADNKKIEDDWTGMINWLTYGVKDKVVDWLYDLVAAHKEPNRSGQPPTVFTAAICSPARKPFTATQRNSKAAIPQAKMTLRVDNTFKIPCFGSTPELSMCSTADTSFNSLGSNLSMPHFDPFPHTDDLLRSPTVNAQAGRKVKALPERAQLPTLPESLYTNDPGTSSATGTRFLMPDEAGPRSVHPQVINAQATFCVPTQPKQSACPPFDVLGPAPVPSS